MSKKADKDKQINKEAEEIAKYHKSEVFKAALKKVKELLPDKLDVAEEFFTHVVNVLKNKELDDATFIYFHKFVRLSSGAEFKAILSVGELREQIAKSKLGSAFFQKLLGGIGIIRKAKDWIGKFENAIQVIYTLVTIDQNRSASAIRAKEKTARDKIRDMELAYDNMSKFMDVVKVINTLSPKGFKEYINYNIEFFQNIQGIMDICKAHSMKILKLLEELDRLEEEARKNPNSVDRWRQRIEHDPDWFDK